jgi:hypothetical protein
MDITRIGLLVTRKTRGAIRVVCPVSMEVECLNKSGTKYDSYKYEG